MSNGIYPFLFSIIALGNKTSARIMKLNKFQGISKKVFGFTTKY